MARKIVLALFVAGFLLRGVKADESLGQKLKDVFAPTPTPSAHRHKSSSSAAKKKHTPAAAEDSPKPKTSPSPKKKKASPSPTPSPTETETPSPSPSASPTETPSVTPSPSVEKKKGAPVTLPATQISGFENYPTIIQNLINLSLGLAAKNLQYKYGSADPASGGLDCSGFIFYVLTQSGVRDVPRDASEQYIWVRKSGKFQAVVSRHDDTFELRELKPGDLLFWTGTYSVERDPPITHVMIYLGREKGSGHPIMIGASDGRTYKGESRFGVSVFDFKLAHSTSGNAEGRVPTFVGYGPAPGL